MPPHGLLVPISSKGSFICTIPQTGWHIPRPLLHQSWSTGCDENGWNEKWVHHEGSIRRPIAQYQVRNIKLSVIHLLIFVVDCTNKTICFFLHFLVITVILQGGSASLVLSLSPPPPHTHTLLVCQNDWFWSELVPMTCV